MLFFTIALHALALTAVLVDESSWRWALGAVAANHALLAGLAVQPRGRLLGRNVSRLSVAASRRKEIALTIDDGPDPDVTPKVLDILDAHGAKATFFCVGSNVARHPAIARDILRRGHAIENHSERHRWHFALMGFGGLKHEISTAQASIAAVTGTPPMFFRAPAGVRSPFLDSVLRRLGLRLASWTRRGFDTVDRDPETVLARLLRRLSAGDILLLHDGHSARTAAGMPVIVEVLPRLLEAITNAGLTTVTLRSGVR